MIDNAYIIIILLFILFINACFICLYAYDRFTERIAQEQQRESERLAREVLGRQFKDTEDKIAPHFDTNITSINEWLGREGAK